MTQANSPPTRKAVEGTQICMWMCFHVFDLAACTCIYTSISLLTDTKMLEHEKHGDCVVDS